MNRAGFSLEVPIASQHYLSSPLNRYINMSSVTSSCTTCMRAIHHRASEHSRDGTPFIFNEEHYMVSVISLLIFNDWLIDIVFSFRYSYTVLPHFLYPTFFPFLLSQAPPHPLSPGSLTHLNLTAHISICSL